MTEQTGVLQQKKPSEIAQGVFDSGLSVDWVTMMKAGTEKEARELLGDEVYGTYLTQFRSVRLRQEFERQKNFFGATQVDVDAAIKDKPRHEQLLKDSTIPEGDPLTQIRHVDLRRRVLLLHRAKIQSDSAAKRAEIRNGIKAIDEEIKKLQSQLRAQRKPEGFSEDEVKSAIARKETYKKDEESRSNALLVKSEEIAASYMQEAERLSIEVLYDLYAKALQSGQMPESFYEQMILNRTVSTSAALLVLERKRRTEQGKLDSPEKPKGYDEAKTKAELEEILKRMEVEKKYADVSVLTKGDARMLELYQQQYERGILTYFDVKRRTLESRQHFAPRALLTDSVTKVFSEWPSNSPEKVSISLQRLKSFDGAMKEYQDIVTQRMNDILLTCPQSAGPDEMEKHVSEVIRKAGTMTALFLNNPGVEQINAGGRKQLFNEILSHVLFPHYNLDLIVGFGGSRDKVNARVPAYIMPPLAVIRGCIKNNIRPPRLRILNAYALAVEINHMPPKETGDIAKKTDRVLQEFVTEFYPEVRQYEKEHGKIIESDIPELGYLKDGPVSNDSQRIGDFYEELSEKFAEYPRHAQEADKVAWVKKEKARIPKGEQEMWDKDFVVWKSLEGLIERGRVRLKELLRVRSEKQGVPPPEPTHDQLERIKRTTFTYIAAHPWAFDNLVSFYSSSTNQVPHGVIKFGGHGEVNFNHLQEYLVKLHKTEDAHDVLYMPTGTAGMKSLQGKVSTELDPVALEDKQMIDLPAAPVNITMKSEHPPYYAADKELPPEDRYEVEFGGTITPEDFERYFYYGKDGEVRTKPGAPDIISLSEQIDIKKYAAFCTRMGEIVKAKI